MNKFKGVYIMLNEELKQALASFGLDDGFEKIEPLGIGNINSSYKVTLSGGRQYALQKLNTNIFKKPDEVMSNIMKVTGHLRSKIIAEGGNPSRETLNFLVTREGAPLFRFTEDSVYRAYEFIDDAITIQSTGSTDEAYKAAYTFGKFQNRLSDFDASVLFETIPDFHNTAKRFENLEASIKADVAGRLDEVRDLVDFCYKEKYLAHAIVDDFANGVLPIRVTHNDTKINNVLFDAETKEGMCVIDLDTVMPATSLYDFGDMIRSGAAYTVEDETDLSLVGINLDYYGAFVKGFKDGVGKGLTEAEISRLALSAKVITFEIGIRFLTDYLDGDIYFALRRPDHNKVRAANQFKLLSDMEEKFEQMKSMA